MRKYAVVMSLALAAAVAFAQDAQPGHSGNAHIHLYPTKDRFVHQSAGPGGGSNLSYHGGPVLTQAKVVAIFWGSAWGTPQSPSGIATSLTNFIDGNGSSIPGFGLTGEFNVITQYYGPTGAAIQQSNLGSAGGSLYDTGNPTSTNVTDAMMQQEVLKLTNNAPRTDTVYEVFIPNGYYSSSGSSDSCGGPNLQYCAYHGHFSFSGLDVKYASMPYPSCGGCQSSGFSDTQNLEHFISHETREAVTDEDLNAWFDRRGYEADDKCAWSPTPFTDSATGVNADNTPFAYQYEWSNANSGCVKTR
ncbi:MAG: hypothetical protein ACR2IF_00300 [Terriglobales bacterium]